jgi:hypothetical protein
VLASSRYAPPLTRAMRPAPQTSPEAWPAPAAPRAVRRRADRGDHPTSLGRRRLRRFRWSLLASSPAFTGASMWTRRAGSPATQACCAAHCSAGRSRLKRKGSLCVRSSKRLTRVNAGGWVYQLAGGRCTSAGGICTRGAGIRLACRGGSGSRGNGGRELGRSPAMS